MLPTLMSYLMAGQLEVLCQISLTVMAMTVTLTCIACFWVYAGQLVVSSVRGTCGYLCFLLTKFVYLSAVVLIVAWALTQVPPEWSHYINEYAGHRRRSLMDHPDASAISFLSQWANSTRSWLSSKLS